MNSQLSSHRNNNTVNNYTSGKEVQWSVRINNQVRCVLHLCLYFVSSYLFFKFSLPTNQGQSSFSLYTSLLEKNVRYLIVILTNGNNFIFICSGGQVDLSRQASWKISICQLGLMYIKAHAPKDIEMELKKSPFLINRVCGSSRIKEVSLFSHRFLSLKN